MMNIFDIFPIREKIAIPSFADALGQHTPYFLVKDVLHGGMGGCVRLEAENGEEYAFKIILPDKFNSEESLNRYLNELKKWRTFSMCDGILRAYDIIKYNDIPCVISTWMQQGDLHSLMISKERTVFYNTLHRIVGSLKWVYDNYHTIHRDLKPANILVDENYLPYIADWGLCKTLGESSTDKDCSKSQIPSESFTADDFVVGTWGFAPSEQMSGSNDIDCRADIFALGVIKS